MLWPLRAVQFQPTSEYATEIIDKSRQNDRETLKPYGVAAYPHKECKYGYQMTDSAWAILCLMTALKDVIVTKALKGIILPIEQRIRADFFGA